MALNAPAPRRPLTRLARWRAAFRRAWRGSCPACRDANRQCYDCWEAGQW